jgi:c-di-AMP phosphodiesterase-like protein
LNLCIIATIGFRFNSSKYDIGCFIYLKNQSKLAKKIVYIIIMTATISHTMRKKLEAIKEMVSVQEAAKKMKEQSLLVVVDGSGKSQV